MRKRFALALSALLLALLVAPLPIARGQGDDPTAGIRFPAPGAPAGQFVVRIYYDHPEEIGRLAEFDVFEYNNVKEQYVLAAVDAQGYDRLQALGFRVQIDPQETANFTRPSLALPDQADGIPGYTCYRTVEETYATAAAIVTAHPGLAAWIDAGDSWEKTAVTSPDTPGYDMMVLKLTNSAISGPKPKLFITSSIHAREYAPAELMTRFAEHLVNNYGIDADVTWLLDWHEIHLMLQANPDGRKKAETGLSWRKNTNQAYCGATSNSRGADLNRNFAFYWGTCPVWLFQRRPVQPDLPRSQRGVRAGDPGCSDLHETPSSPTSAPSRSTPLRQTTRPASTSISTVSASWCSGPGGSRRRPRPTAPPCRRWGASSLSSTTTRRSSRSASMPTDGTTHDFAYGDLGVAAYTFEIGTKFFESCTDFESTIIPDNMPALLYAAKVVRTPYQTPAGPEALNVTASPVNVTQGSPAALAASLDDTRFKGAEPAQNIAAAEYYVDVPPWDTAHGPVAHPMAAADGSFDSTVENVTAAVDTGSLTVGRHIIFVRGQDAAGNWGPFSAAFLNVTPCVRRPRRRG